VELLGVAVSLPGAFLLTAIYTAILLRTAQRLRWVARVFRPISCLVLGLFLLELILITTLGAVQSRTMFGPAFFAVHNAIFFLGTPALANVLLLRERRPSRFLVCSVCAILGFVLVLIGADVNEKLFGIDDVGGPFSY
jgi:hypothetical protein